MEEGIKPGIEDIDITIVPLSSLIKVFKRDYIQILLDGFKCSKSEDVSAFLHRNSLPYEDSNKSRTYLITTTQSYEAPDKDLDLVGYFTIALKYVAIGKKISKTKRRKMTGLFPDDNTVVYLIGQLAKNDNTNNSVPGSMILDAAITKIRNIQGEIGGRLVLVECARIPKLISFYESNGFEYLQDDPKDNMAQLFYFL